MVPDIILGSRLHADDRSVTVCVPDLRCRSVLDPYFYLFSRLVSARVDGLRLRPVRSELPRVDSFLIYPDRNVVFLLSVAVRYPDLIRHLLRIKLGVIRYSNRLRPDDGRLLVKSGEAEERRRSDHHRRDDHPLLQHPFRLSSCSCLRNTDDAVSCTFSCVLPFLQTVLPPSCFFFPLYSRKKRGTMKFPFFAEASFFVLFPFSAFPFFGPKRKKKRKTSRFGTLLLFLAEIRQDLCPAFRSKFTVAHDCLHDAVFVLAALDCKS